MKFDPREGSLDIAALRASYESGSLTPEALVEALYERMERPPTPHAWIHRVSKEEARACARALQSDPQARELPLYGIPFAVKDNIDVAGMPTTAGCPAYAYTPDKSADAVAALLEAGALCLGKVNLDQFATGLVGSRSPYGACQNVFDPEVLSGGSSSGSAVVVASHHVSFALGTDTAGSGRVPAALNNLVGLKPTVGLVSADGVVAACASLDCVSVFALSVADAAAVLEVMARQALPAPSMPAAFRFGVPRPLELFGDAESAALFARACDELEQLGGRKVEVDFTPFAALGDMLYGPTVLERYQAVGSFIEAQPDAVLPVTRTIILGGKQVGPADVVQAQKRIAALKAACWRALDGVDVFVTPTIPRPYQRAEDAAEPRIINDRLGIYTRFVNYLGCAVLSVPAGFRGDGLPFGVSLVGAPGKDSSLWELGAELHVRSRAGMGKARHELSGRAQQPAKLAQVAVVGAHMRGLALNQQLLELDARYVKTTRTAPSYRLYVLPGTQPERPGLVRVEGEGRAIELEVWSMSWEALGKLMSRVPPPLAIGTLALEGGDTVKGFLCEAHATRGARDISELGGYRRYLEQK